MSRAFRQVDVFTDTPYLGNPVAVVLEADGVETAEMTRFTRWTNLSEAAFLLAPSDPTADYRLRIFTSAPGTGARSTGELPFAGHPTLGGCHAWLEAGGAPRRGDRIVQECGAGLIAIRRDGGTLAFAAPPLLRSGRVEPGLRERIAGMLGLDPGEIVDAAWVDNGPGWVGVLLESAEAVLALQPGRVELEVGVAGPYPAHAPQAFEVRTFIPGHGAAVEDPVTGSFNAGLAQWLLATGRAQAPYTVSQGTVLGRRGRVEVSRDADGTIWVGGGTLTCISGQVEL
jgi:PhzF family phenazine biosynthesis protein